MELWQRLPSAASLLRIRRLPNLFAQTSVPTHRRLHQHHRTRSRRPLFSFGVLEKLWNARRRCMDESVNREPELWNVPEKRDSTREQSTVRHCWASREYFCSWRRTLLPVRRSPLATDKVLWTRGAAAEQTRFKQAHQNKRGPNYEPFPRNQRRAGRKLARASTQSRSRNARPD